jgi:hypothetical protein
MKIYHGVLLTYLNVLVVILSSLQHTSVTEFITDRVSGIIVDAVDTAVAPCMKPRRLTAAPF